MFLPTNMRLDLVGYAKLIKIKLTDPKFDHKTQNLCPN